MQHYYSHGGLADFCTECGPRLEAEKSAEKRRVKERLASEAIQRDERIRRIGTAIAGSGRVRLVETYTVKGSFMGISRKVRTGIAAFPIGQIDYSHKHPDPRGEGMMVTSRVQALMTEDGRVVDSGGASIGNFDREQVERALSKLAKERGIDVG